MQDLFNNQNFYNNGFSTSDLAQRYNLNSQAPAGNSGFELNSVDPSTPKISGLDKVGTGLQAFDSLANAYMAYKQYQLGKDSLNFSKGAFNRNLANQANITNKQLKDRINRRAHSNPNLLNNPDALEASVNKEFDTYKVSGEAI